MNKFLNKAAMFLANFSLLVNTFLTPLTVYAQDATPPADPAPVEESVTPPAEETPAPPAETTPAPEETTPAPEEVTPTVEETVVEEVTTTPAPEETTPAPEEVTPTVEETTEETTTETPGGETTEQTEETTEVEAVTNEENATVEAIVVENVDAASVTEDEVVYDGTGTPQLQTDKADYAPTDVVLITGTGFEANKEYDLVITGTGDFRFDDKVKSDESGGLFYTYQLDGTYRPDYKVEILDSGSSVSSVTFTDAATGTLYPNGQGFYTAWTGDEDDVDETGTPDCEDNSADGNDNVSETTTNDRESVLIDLSSVSDGSTITSVEVFVTYRNGNDNGADNGTFQTFTRFNGTNLDSGVNLVATDDTCTSGSQIINVADAVKSGATTLEVGVLKTATDTSEVWVGTIRAVVTYDPAPQPDLTAIKTNNVSGNATVNQAFTWTIRVQNSGAATATFSNNQNVLWDERPSTGVSSYGTPVITTSGTTGNFDCTLSGTSSRDVVCEANGAATMPVGSYIDVAYTVTPNATGTLSNPRSGESCLADDGAVVTESNEGNNNCSDSVTVNPDTGVTNPTLPQACGLDIALVLDNSGSISGSELTQMKNAMTAFTTAFNGTPTQFSVTKFATTGSVVQDFTANITDVNNAINGIPEDEGATNWEDGLLDAQSTLPNRVNPNLMIFASDGNPNRVDNGTTVSESQAVAEAKVVADSIKTGGTRILALGIGNELDTVNLQTISGPSVNSGITSDVITSDFATLAADLAEYAILLCGGTINITKLVDGNPANGWTFTVSGEDPVVTAGSGQVSVPVDAGNYSVTETLQPGYSFVSASCTGATNNGVQGVNSVTGLQVGENDIVSCTFNNSYVPVCGDGVVNGQEQCDLGAQNGVACTPTYGNSCNYCSANCTTTTVQGPYCGDGIKNGAEACDGSDLGGLSSTNYSCTQQCSLQLVDPDVDICHATGSHGNPYITNSPSKSGDVSGHDGHSGPVWFPGIAVVWGDIIPPFDYIGGSYPGKNWTTEGQAIYRNNCTYPTGTLIVKKVVVGSNDLPSAFSFQVNGDTAESFEADGQNDLTVNVGTYDVTEPAVAGYTTTYDNCEKVEVSGAETETCTITNTKDTGSVKVNKRVDANGDGDWNDSGEGVNGSASNAFNWNLDTVGTNVMGSTVSSVPTGNHDVNENSVAGYHFTGWFVTSDTSKTCANTTNTLPATISVAKGQTKEITLCNQRDKGTIVIVKEAVPTSEDNFSFDTVSGFPGGDFELEDDGNDNNGGTEESKTISVVTGQYWVKEDGENGWALTDLVCSDGQSQVPSTVNLGDRKATINVEAGETVTCTFTNKKLAKLIIKKETLPNDSNKEFDFTRSFGGGFDLEDGDSRTFENLQPGDYTVTEVGENGWVLQSVVCSDQTQASEGSVTVNLDYNETVTCTFNNMELGKILGYKFYDKDADGNKDLLEPKLNGWRIFIDENDNGTYDDGEPSDTTSGQFWFLGWHDSGEYGFDNLLPGTYKVCEELQNGWTASTPVCQTTQINSNGGDEDDLNFGNYRPLTLGVYKVLCENEADLPNWGEGGPNINANTAQDWVNSHEGCELVADWAFQYGFEEDDANKYLNGDQTGEAPAPWKTLGTTDANGYAEVTISDPKAPGGVWVREVLPSDEYVPFSYPPAGPEENDFSAELYCHKDVNHYDNYDQVDDPEFGETYYCVAFNALNNGDLQVCKYDDYDGDGKKDEGEPGIPGVTMTINPLGEENELVAIDQVQVIDEVLPEGDSKDTGRDGCVIWEKLDLGSYEVTEDLADLPGYNPTADYVDGSSDGEANGEVVAEVKPGQTTLVEFLNELQPVTITLEKAADEEATGPGDIIFYTLKVKNTSDHTAYDASVSDFTPFGFTYQTGSTEIDDVASSDPSISGPVLTWTLGTMTPGQEVKVEYQMKAPDPLSEGTYTNIALAVAYNRPSVEEILGEASLLDFLVTEVNAGTPHPDATRAESQVAFDVVKYTKGVSFSATVGGQVLGASTVLGATLPASGSETYILLALLSTLTLGVWFKFLSAKVDKKN